MFLVGGPYPYLVGPRIHDNRCNRCRTRGARCRCREVERIGRSFSPQTSSRLRARYASVASRIFIIVLVLRLRGGEKGEERRSSLEPARWAQQGEERSAGRNPTTRSTDRARSRRDRALKRSRNATPFLQQLGCT